MVAETPIVQRLLMNKLGVWPRNPNSARWRYVQSLTGLWQRSSSWIGRLSKSQVGSR